MTAAARRAGRGFTLVELAVTMTLLVLLIALGIPSFMTWIRNTQVRTVADSLQTGIRQAQTDALRLNRSVVFFTTNGTPSPAAAIPAVVNGKSWGIVRIAQVDDLTAWNQRYITGGILSDVASNVAITSPTNTNAICFNANGRISSNTNAATSVAGAVCNAGIAQFDITQTNADRRLRVRVALGGQIHMCDPDRPTLSATSPDGCP